MTSTKTRTLVAAGLAFAVSLLVSMLNGLGFPRALYSAAVMAVIAGVAVAVLSWAITYSQEKGYPGWLGFFLVFFLNLIGIFILLVLPVRESGNQAMS